MSSLNSLMVDQKLPKVCANDFLLFKSRADRVADGVTVAKAITLKDKFENLGAR